MPNPRRPASTPGPRPVAWVMWLACALLLQAVCMAYHGTAMAAGVEVCSAEGMKRVAAQDAPESGKTGSGDHDHCCVSALATPPTLEAAIVAFEPPAPASHLSAQRLGAQWLAPLSRGPPAVS